MTRGNSCPSSRKPTSTNASGETLMLFGLTSLRLAAHLSLSDCASVSVVFIIASALLSVVAALPLQLRALEHPAARLFEILLLRGMLLSVRAVEELSEF